MNKKQKRLFQEVKKSRGKYIKWLEWDGHSFLEDNEYKNLELLVHYFEVIERVKIVRTDFSDIGIMYRCVDEN